MFVADYPAYEWPDIDDLEDLKSAAKLRSAARTTNAPGATKRSAPPAMARRFSDSPPANIPRAPETGERRAAMPRRRRPRRIVLGAAAVVLIAVLIRGGLPARSQNRRESTTGAAGETTPRRPRPPPRRPAIRPRPPVPLDGVYRLEVERTKQTFNFTPDPATTRRDHVVGVPVVVHAERMQRGRALQLDDDDHARAKTPAVSRSSWISATAAGWPGRKRAASPASGQPERQARK